MLYSSFPKSAQNPSFPSPLPSFDNVKNRLLHLLFALILRCPNIPILILFIRTGMISVCNHVAGGLLRQRPDVSGCARTGVHLAMRSGGQCSTPRTNYIMCTIDLMQMFVSGFLRVKLLLYGEIGWRILIEQGVFRACAASIILEYMQHANVIVTKCQV